MKSLNSETPAVERKADLHVNCDIMQSSILTDARFDVTRLEQQILIILVAAAQTDLKEYFNGGMESFPNYDKNIQVSFSLRDFPVDMSGHERDLLKAADSLVKKTISTQTEYGWILQPLISKVEYIKPARLVIMEVDPGIWRQIINVKLGYSEYELFTALSLKSKYSVRFYMMASSSQGTREITFNELKYQFNLEEHYNDNNDLLKRIIYPSIKELDEKAHKSFTAKPYRKKGSKEYLGILFTPKDNVPKRDKNLMTKKLTHGKIHVGMALDREEIEWLKRMDKMAFTEPELRKNFETFNVAKKKYGNGLLDAMNGIYEYMLRNNRHGQKGYFIKSLKENATRENSNGEPEMFNQ